MVRSAHDERHWASGPNHGQPRAADLAEAAAGLKAAYATASGGDKDMQLHAIHAPFVPLACPMFSLGYRRGARVIQVTTKTSNEIIDDPADIWTFTEVGYLL